MNYYKRIGRKHARQVLKSFFLGKENAERSCEHMASGCIECLKLAALESFYDFQLKEAMDPNSKFKAPPDKDSENAYMEAAVGLIDKTIERSLELSSTEDILDAESAYKMGEEMMGELINEAIDNFGADEFEIKTSKVLEECWDKLCVRKKDGPKVHSIMVEYFDRGVLNAVSNIEPLKDSKPKEKKFVFPKSL